MGCAGHPLVETPNLDALAERGTRFSNAYTPSPICVPARASFATGRYVHRNRLWDNAMPYDGSIPGWGHALQSAGIAVESIGKLHYRSQEDPAGFDVEHIPMMVAGGVGMVWASIRREDERVDGTGRMLGDYIGPGESKYTDYDAAVVRHTKEWLADRAGPDGPPWCLFVGLVAPHFPLVVRPKRFYDLYPHDRLPPAKLHPKEGYRRHPWVEKQNAFMDSEAKFADESERQRAVASYFGLCSWLDHNVGEILSALDEAGMTESTTVVYTSDHGDNVGRARSMGQIQSLRGKCRRPAHHVQSRRTKRRLRHAGQPARPLDHDRRPVRLPVRSRSRRPPFDGDRSRSDRPRTRRFQRIPCGRRGVGRLHAAQGPLEIQLLRRVSRRNCSISKPTRRNAPTWPRIRPMNRCLPPCMPNS